MIEGTPSSEQNLISVGEDMRFDCTRRNCGGHTIVSLDNIKQYANIVIVCDRCNHTITFADFSDLVNKI